MRQLSNLHARVSTFTRLGLLGLALSAAAPAIASPPILETSPGVWSDSTNQFELINLTNEGLNAGALWQDPMDERLFWGRKLYYSGLPGENQGNEHTWIRWKLAFYRLDEGLRKIEYVRDVAPEGFSTADGRYVFTAYDPAVIQYQTQRYIAFECMGQGFSGSVGVCMGKLNLDGRLITSTTKIVVDGVSTDPELKTHQSGSVPKLVQHPGGVQLSWTSVKLKKDNHAEFVDLRTMAANITLDANGFWKVVGAGAGPIPADSSLANQIFTPAAYGTADAYAVTALGNANTYMVTSSTGGAGCVLPLDPIQNCYRLDVRIGSLPTTAGAINAMPQFLTDLPENPVAYVRPIRAANGKLALLGEYLTPKTQNTAHRQVPAGMYLVRHRTIETYQAPSYMPLYNRYPIMNPIWPVLYPGIFRLGTRLGEFLFNQPYHPTNTPAAWTYTSKQGKDCVTIQNNMLFSPEFQYLSFSLKYKELLHKLYGTLLGRAPNQTEESAWEATYLSQGWYGLVSGISGSPAAAALCAEEGSLSSTNTKTWSTLPPGQSRYITRIFEEVLGRTPSPQDITAWKNAILNQPNQCALMTNGVLNSGEFTAIRSTHERPAQVRRTYWGVLARDVESVAQTNAHAQTIQNVGYASWAAAIAGSGEAKNLCTIDGLSVQ